MVVVSNLTFLQSNMMYIINTTNNHMYIYMEFIFSFVLFIFFNLKSSSENRNFSYL